MNITARILMTILLFIFAAEARSHTFRWNVPVGKRLEMVRTAEVGYYRNKAFVKNYNERNIIDLTCYGKDGEGSKVRGSFNVYRRGEKETVFQLKEQYDSDFLIMADGTYRVPKEYVMPNVRHIPTFPKEDMVPGKSWTAPCEEWLHIFNPHIVMTPKVSYTFVSARKEGKSNIGLINLQYIMDEDLREKDHGLNFPKRIYGFYNESLNWDLDRNVPVNSEGKYRIFFIFGDEKVGFQTLEFRMNIKTEYRIYDQVAKEDREKEKKQVEKEIPDGKGLTVETSEKGIILRMDKVFFDIDSASLRDASFQNLEKLAEVMKKRYPDREIIVEGHTDNTGGRDHNLKLSRGRARTVADFLREKLNTGKISYRGLGPDRPIGDNKTKTGRQKNRRVDIIIKMN